MFTKKLNKVSPDPQISGGELLFKKIQLDDRENTLMTSGNDQTTSSKKDETPVKNIDKSFNGSNNSAEQLNKKENKEVSIKVEDPMSRQKFIQSPTRRESLQSLRPPPMNIVTNRKRSLDDRHIVEAGRSLVKLKKVPVDKIDEDHEEHSPRSYVNSPEIASAEISVKPTRNKYIILICVIGKLIRKFVKLRKKLQSNRLENLQAFHHSIINDNGAGFDETTKAHKSLNWKNMIGNGLSYLNISKIIEKLNQPMNSSQKSIRTPIKFIIKYFKLIIQQLNDRVPVTNPNSVWIIYWGIFLIFCLFYQFYSVSIEIFFDSNWIYLERNRNWVFTIETFLRTVLLADIVFKFNRGFFSNGIIQKNRLLIASRYIHSNLATDVMAMLPLWLLWGPVGSDAIRLFKLLIFLKYYDLRKIFEQIEDYLSLREKYEVFFSLLKVCGSIFVSAHIFACIWYKVAEISCENSEKSWLAKLNLIESGWQTHYLYSLYFILTTMITVGYGDITPTNNLEVVLCIITMLIGCGLFGYSINTMGMILEKINRKMSKKKSNMRIINRYMIRKNVEFDLQSRVRRYLEYIWDEEGDETDDLELDMINKLSRSLREEILLQTNGKILSRCPLFQSNFSEETLLKVLDIMKPVKFAPDEIIFWGDVDEKIYLISKGEVELLLDMEKHHISLNRSNIKEGGFFGELSFFTGHENICSAVSRGFTTCYKINREDFIKIIRQNPHEHEKFCLIKDSVSLYQKFEKVFYFCESCGESNHYITKCPKVMFQPQKELLIEKYVNSKDQVRRPKSRKLSKSFNCLRNFYLINESAKNYKIKNMPYIQIGYESDAEMEELEGLEDVPQLIQKQQSMMSLPQLTKMNSNINSGYHANPSMGFHQLIGGQPSLVFSPTNNLSTNYKSPLPLGNFGLQFNFADERIEKSPKDTKMKTSFSQAVNQRSKLDQENYSPTKIHIRHDVTPSSANKFQRKQLKHKNSLQADDERQSNLMYRLDSKEKIGELLSYRSDKPIEEPMAMMEGDYLPFLDCDVIQNYDLYFPHNNSEIIIKYFEMKREKRIGEKKTERKRAKKISKHESSNYSINILPDEDRRKSFLTEEKQNFNVTGYSQSLIQREEFEKFNKMMEGNSARRRSVAPSPMKKRLKMRTSEQK